MLLADLVKRETLHCWRVWGLIVVVSVGVLPVLDCLKTALTRNLVFFGKVFCHKLAFLGEDVDDREDSSDCSEEDCNCVEHGVTPGYGSGIDPSMGDSPLWIYAPRCVLLLLGGVKREGWGYVVG